MTELESRPWWPAARAVMAREWRQAWQRPADLALHAVFFLMVVALFPLALRPDPTVLALLGPGVLWVALFLAVLLATARLFQDDLSTGVLDAWVLSGVPLAVLVLARMGVQWVLAAVPVGLCVPLVALQFGLAGPELGVLLLALALGTAVLVMLACVAAALSAGARGGAVLPLLLVLPLAAPALVFGTLAVRTTQLGGDAEPELSVLAGLCVISLMICPWLGGAAVRVATES